MLIRKIIHIIQKFYQESDLEMFKFFSRIENFSECHLGLICAGLTVFNALTTDTATAMSPQHLPMVEAVHPPRGFEGICERYIWVCSADAGQLTGEADILKLGKRINLKVNRKYRQVEDQYQYGLSEFWSLPTSMGGDCEDFALAKKKELVSRGVPPQRLLITTVLDRDMRAHAVLVLRMSDGDFVLDSQTNRIKLWSDTGYSFLRMQNPDAPEQWLAVFAGGFFESLQP